MNMEEVRAKYPQYSNMPDADLAKGLHQKYYSDIPFDEFAKQIGFSAKPALVGNPAAGGKLDSLWRGIKDPFVAGDQLINNAAAKFRLPQKVADDFNAKVTQDEQQFQADRKAAGRDGVDWMRLGGNVGVTLPASLIAGPGIPAAIASGAGLGALQPVTGDDFWKEKGKQTAIGGLAGGVGGVLAKGLSSVISPNTGANAKTLLDAGVRLTPGQTAGGITKRLEDTATSIPFAGNSVISAQRRSIEDFNRAAVNRGLESIGVKLPKGIVGHEAIDFADDAISSGYKQLVPQLTPKVDSQFVRDVQSLAAKAGTELEQTRADQFAKILKVKIGEKIGPQGQMSGVAWKEADSEIGRLAREYSRSLDAGQRGLGMMLRDTQEMLRNMVLRSNPDKADALNALNKAFATHLRVERAAASTGSVDGVFTPAALSQAVKSLDGSLRHKAVSKGEALLQDLSNAGKAVLPSSIPDSGTAGRVGLMSLLTGGAAVIDPLTTSAVGAGLGAAYSKSGQAMLRSLMTSRPEAAKAIADLVQRGLPFPLAASTYKLLNE